MLLLLSTVLLGCPRKEPSKGPGQEILSGEAGFLKGQLHLHSNNSGDSATTPADVVRWYEAHRYDFIVFTDHERVTALPSTASMLVIPGVELTQNLKRCEPAAPAGLGCLLHVNALFVKPPPGGAVPWPPAAGIDRIGRYRRALAATEALGGIAQLNHPNFDYSADAALVTALAGEGLRLLEIANQAWDSYQRTTFAGGVSLSPELFEWTWSCPLRNPASLERISLAGQPNVASESGFDR